MTAPKKHRRGASAVNDLVKRFHWLVNQSLISPERTSLSEVCNDAAFWVRESNEIKQYPHRHLTGAVVLVAMQRSVITEQQWQDEIRTIYYDREKFDAAIDLLFERIMGRFPDRSPKHIRQEAESVWGQIELPYTPAQMDYLLRAFEYKRAKEHGRKFNHTDSRRFYVNKSIDFDDSWLNPKPAQAESSCKSLRSILQDWFDKREEEYGGRYGYGIKISKHPSIEAESINPEHIAHDDQAAIDATFLDLLGEMEL